MYFESINDQSLCFTRLDVYDVLQVALTTVQPSAKREGFATVPDVTWDDIGALQDVREELQLAILVKQPFHILCQCLFTFLSLMII